MDVLRVVLVDDHPVIRQGIVGLLEQSHLIEVIGQADSGEACLQLCAKLDPALPDVILIDLNMPGIGGLETIRRLKHQFPRINVIVLTSVADEDMILATLHAGASGYLTKDSNLDEIVNIIRTVSSGYSIIKKDLASKVIRLAYNPNMSDSFDLTDREIEILQLLTKGLSNPDIAESLGISRSTVKTHLVSIFRKLNTSSRTEAIAIANNHQLV